jgi:hypothetical protein
MGGLPRESKTPLWLVAVLLLAVVAVGSVGLGVGYGACNENPDAGPKFGRQVCDHVGVIDLVAVVLVPALFVFLALAFHRAAVAVTVLLVAAIAIEAAAITILAIAA